MRLNEAFEKQGYFWLPSYPDQRVPGTLCINDGGDITLEILGLLGGLESINKSKNIPRVCGHIENSGYVTLDGCYYSNRKLSFGGVSKSAIRANTAFVGIAYGEGKVTSFKTFQFSVEGLDEWVGVSGIKTFHSLEDKTATITYEPQQEIVLNLKSGMQLCITFAWTLPGGPNIKEAKITHKTYFKLVPPNEVPLQDFISLAHKIANFLCFAIDQTVCIEGVTATSESIQLAEGARRSRAIPIKIYYSSLPYSKNKAKIDIHRMLFRFNQISSDAEAILNNWLYAYEKIEPSLNLYFSVKTGNPQFLESRFLSLTQALETYHRRSSNKTLMSEVEYETLVSTIVESCPAEKRDWLSGRLRHGNEINLAKRIKEILEPFKHAIGSSEVRRKLIRSIVDTRNYLTHYDQSLEEKALADENLWVACIKIEAIFQLHLLKILDFKEHEIASVLEENGQLQHKLSYQPDSSKAAETSVEQE